MADVIPPYGGGGDPDHARLHFSLNGYDFELPPELIAAFPSKERGDDRLLVLDRGAEKGSDAEFHHRHFSDLSSFLRAGDLLVFNDARVHRARLRAHKLPGGGAAEILLLRAQHEARDMEPDGVLDERIYNEKLWECLVSTNRPIRAGQVFRLADGSYAEVRCTAPGGRSGGGAPGGSVLIAFEKSITVDFMECYGELPLPPYIMGRRARGKAQPEYPPPMDDERYQTVYADRLSALAAPTAGLHFTKEGLAALQAAGVRLAYLTLEVGWGTFAPIRAEDIRAHHMHSEFFEISPELVREIERAKNEGRRVVAVGTTVVRALEAAAQPDALRTEFAKTRAISAGCEAGCVPEGPAPPRMATSAGGEAGCVPEGPAPPDALRTEFAKTRAISAGGEAGCVPEGPAPPGRAISAGRYETDIFIFPGYRFQMVDALITNFHTPRSSLLALVSAFAGRERILAAYAEAAAQRYRFFSYGDAMLIL